MWLRASSRLPSAGAWSALAGRGFRPTRLTLVGFFVAMIAAGEVGRQIPVALILKPAGALLIRAGSQATSTAKPGDLLFAGDAIRTASEQVSFLFCPGGVAPVLQSGTEVVLDEKQITVKAGKVIEMKPVASCYLPAVQGLSRESQQTYGAFVTRGPADGSSLKQTPKDQWPAGLAEEMAPVEAVLAGDAKDPAGLIARAVLFEKYKLPSDALTDYYRVALDWPDAPWLPAKILELQRAVTRNAILEANPGWR